MFVTGGPFLPTWRRIEAAAAMETKARPAASAAVFSDPSDDVPEVPELMALSDTYTAG